MFRRVRCADHQTRRRPERQSERQRGLGVSQAEQARDSAIADHAIAAAAALGTELGTTLGGAGLLVELADTHLLFDATPLNQLAESADGFLGRFFVSKGQLNHVVARSGDRLSGSSRARKGLYKSPAYRPAAHHRLVRIACFCGQRYPPIYPTPNLGGLAGKPAPICLTGAAGRARRAGPRWRHFGAGWARCRRLAGPIWWGQAGFCPCLRCDRPRALPCRIGRKTTRHPPSGSPRSRGGNSGSCRNSTA